MSKFGYEIGTGSYEVRVRSKKLKDKIEINLHAYLDEEWPEVEAMEEPCDRIPKSRQNGRLFANASGEWGGWTRGTLSQSDRPHIWYFAVSDCGIHTTRQFEFEARFLQDGGSEFSVEMHSMLITNVVFLVAFTYLLVVFFGRTKDVLRLAGSIHPVIWTLCVTLAVQYLAQLAHTIHLVLYRSNGSGVRPLEVISVIMLMLSQVSQDTLLILISLGYTLLQSKIGDLNAVMHSGFFSVLVHSVLVGIGKFRDDASYKYHENEGAPGWILLGFRMVLFVLFLQGVQTTAQEGRHNQKLKAFLSHYKLVGTMYFLAYPAIFLVTRLFAPYWQHLVMSVGVMSMQLGLSAWLASLFLTRGAYYAVSTLNVSELPGGCSRLGLVKDK